MTTAPAPRLAPADPRSERWDALRQRWPLALAGNAVLVLLAGCSSPMPQDPPPPVPTATPASPAAPAQSRPATPPPAPAQAPPAPPSISSASNPRDYRKDAAGHLYALNAHRIHKGKMQPSLYAIGVLQVDVDRQGRVTALRWMRAPSHAPEVVTEIERTVRAAAPFPLPQRMGRVTYTDTWLWDKSGQFQLDTLTEGQL